MNNGFYTNTNNNSVLDPYIAAFQDARQSDVPGAVSRFLQATGPLNMMGADRPPHTNWRNDPNPVRPPHIQGPQSILDQYTGGTQQAPVDTQTPYVPFGQRYSLFDSMHKRMLNPHAPVNATPLAGGTGNVY